jgi:hypothetical protein
MTRESIARLAILGAILVGLALRTAGLDYGLPHDLRPDEHYYVESARAIELDEDSWPPHHAYPGMAWHASYVALRSGHAIEAFTGIERPFVEYLADPRASRLAIRWLSVLLGVASIALAAWLSWRLAGAGPAVATAWFLAIAFLAVRDAHAGTLDVGSGFAVLLAVLAIDDLARRGGRNRALLAGAAIGLAIAWRYLPAVLFAPFAFAAFVSAPRGDFGTRARAALRRTAQGLGAAIAVVLATMPYLLLNPWGFLTSLTDQANTSNSGDATLAECVRYMLGDGLDAALGPLLAIVALLALLVLPRLHGARGALVSLAAAALLLPLATIERAFFRYLDPALPLLCAAAGVLVVRLASLAPAARARLPLALAVVALLSADPLRRSVALAKLYRVPHVGIDVAKWYRESANDRTIATIGLRGLEGIPAERLALVTAATWPPELPYLLALERGAGSPVDRIALHESMLRSDPGATLAASFRSFAPGGHEAARFEVFDWSDYPWRGFEHLHRAGPDIDFWRVDAWPAEPDPPPPVLSFEPATDGGKIHLRDPRGSPPLAFAITLAPGEGGAKVSVVVPGDVEFLAVPPTVPRGRHLVTARLRTLRAQSAPSPPLELELE